MGEYLNEQKILNRLTDKLKLSRASDIIRVEKDFFSEGLPYELTHLYFVDGTSIKIESESKGFFGFKTSYILSYYHEPYKYFPTYKTSIVKSLYDDLLSLARYLDEASIETRTDRKLREMGL